ncbi:hypothetical protein JCM17380_23530 [Desulfosporosinus burensis]
MSKKKRRSGHYCKICSEYKSNESFSGKGHANHICRRCSKKSPTEQAADITLNRLFNMPFRKLSPAEKSWLENRLHDQREEVKSAAQEIYRLLYPHAERNNRKKQLHINKLSFRIHSKVYEELRDVQNAKLFEADKVSNNIVQTEFASDGSPASRQEKFMLDIDMAKFLKWIVHSLEIFEWEQDYGQNNNSFNVLGDDQIYSDEFDCFEECMIDIEKEIDNVEPETITWNVEVYYSNGIIQKTSGTHVYLPEKVEELYWGFQEFFAPAYSKEEECEEDMELQTDIDDLPF